MGSSWDESEQRFTQCQARVQVHAPFGAGAPVQCSKDGAYLEIPHPSSLIVLYSPKRGIAGSGQPKSSLTRGIVAKKGGPPAPPDTCETHAKHLPNTCRTPAENLRQSYPTSPTGRPSALGPPAARSAHRRPPRAPSGVNFNFDLGCSTHCPPRWHPPSRGRWRALPVQGGRHGGVAEGRVHHGLKVSSGAAGRGALRSCAGLAAWSTQ